MNLNDACLVLCEEDADSCLQCVEVLDKLNALPRNLDYLYEDSDDDESDDGEKEEAEPAKPPTPAPTGKAPPKAPAAKAPAA